MCVRGISHGRFCVVVNMHLRHSFHLIGWLMLAGCGGDVSSDRDMPARPVTVLALVERDFVRERTLTGAVMPYREERIGFEVAGRVTTVLDQGLEVRGPAYDEHGALIRRGDAIASMEDTRYGRQVGALQARLDAARRDLDAVNARLILARRILKRQQSIRADGLASQQTVDDAQSVFDQASAQLLARQATVNQVTEELRRASEDLGDAVLFAPFSGRITAVHIAEGAVVQVGDPVVTLTLMDPVQIQVEVSADNERDIKTGDRAVIFPKDPLLNGDRVPINTIVFEKSSAADPELRTFRIDLMVRNERRHLAEIVPELQGLPVVNQYLPVVREYQGEAGPLFVHTDSVLAEGDKTFVLRLPGVSFHAGAQRGAVGKHVPERIEVSLGDQYTTVVNWTFRSLADAGDLAEGDFLIVGARPEHAAGVAVGRPQWLLRTRDLVPVQFDIGKTLPGYYVPLRAVTTVNAETVVFVVADGRAQAAPVTVHETYGELVRIEGAAIAAGAQVIVDGVHYVSDGQPITIAASASAQ